MWGCVTNELAPHVIYKNASFHCVQAAHPQLELDQKRIFIDYMRCEFCVLQTYKSVEKDLGMGTGEIGTPVNYFSEGLTLEATTYQSI